MVAGRERLLDDVELGRRHVLVVRQREQKGLLRGDVVRLRRFAPRAVAEAAAYLAAHPLKATTEEHTSSGTLRSAPPSSVQIVCRCDVREIPCTHQYYHVRRTDVVAVAVKRRRRVSVTGCPEKDGLRIVIVCTIAYKCSYSYRYSTSVCLALFRAATRQLLYFNCRVSLFFFYFLFYKYARVIWSRDILDKSRSYMVKLCGIQ